MKRTSKLPKATDGRIPKYILVLKRYRERQERLELINKVYELGWGKMYLKKEKIQYLLNKEFFYRHIIKLYLNLKINSVNSNLLFFKKGLNK